MHIWHDKRPGVGRQNAGALPSATKRAAAAGILLAACAGCASPGPPLPPSLKLPAVVAANEITATRVGDAVALHWTTPTHTTDKLLITGPITAVICRDTPSATPLRPGWRTTAPPCSPVQRLPVAPGPSDAVDPLPAALTSGPARLLAYRVELMNAADRTAGPSPAVFVAAGTAPAPVADLRVDATKDGALLRWHAEAAAGDAVELDRTTVEAPAPAAAKAVPERSNSPPISLPGQAKEPAESRFQAGPSDAGGTLDRTALIGRTYTYTAQRVRKVTVGDQSYELRSAPSAPVTVAVRDVFPPAVPAGLVAVPGFTGEGETQKPAIDLSWDPDVERRVAGYRVYRREGDAGAWQHVGPDPMPVPAYRDPAVAAGHIYTYRVTAVSTAGNESAPSTEVTETAPAP